MTQRLDTGDETTTQGPGWRIAARAGLVLAALQAVPNTLNGGVQVFGGGLEVDGETVPLWVGLSLLVAGLVTLVALVPAWRGDGRAIWAVALSRFSEVTGLLVLVDAFPVEEGAEGFYVVLAVVSVAIGLLVLMNLRPRR